MTTAEKLAALGYPVCREGSAAMGVKPVPSLDPRRGSSCIGNAMHFMNSSIILLIGLTCFGRQDECDMIDWTAAKRRRTS